MPTARCSASKLQINLTNRGMCSRSNILQDSTGEFSRGAPAQKRRKDRCGISQRDRTIVSAERTLHMLAETTLHPPRQPLSHQLLRFGVSFGIVLVSPQIAPAIQACLQIHEPGGGCGCEFRASLVGSRKLMSPKPRAPSGRQLHAG